MTGFDLMAAIKKKTLQRKISMYLLSGYMVSLRRESAVSPRHRAIETYVI